MSGEKESLQSKMQEQLASQISNLFGSVLSERSDYFQKNPEKIPDQCDIPDLIRKYARTNSVISGGASLIPGPWGMVAVIPELVAVTRNQIVMIHEIGMASGKGKILTKELLAGIFLTALGSSAGSLLVLHGGKVLVKRASLRAFQRVIVLLAGRKITQQALKSTISKWLPVVGAAAMAAWSGHLTHRIGNKATEIFGKDIILEDDQENLHIMPVEIEADYAQNFQKDASDSLVEKFEKFENHNHVVKEVSKLESLSSVSPKEESHLNLLKIQSLVYLMKIDGAVEQEEKDFISKIVENASLKGSEIRIISSILSSDKKIQIDYSIFKKYPEDALDLLINLVTLANRDGDFHITEKMYIKQVGKLLDFSSTDIEDIIDSVSP